MVVALHHIHMTPIIMSSYINYYTLGLGQVTLLGPQKNIERARATAQSAVPQLTQLWFPDESIVSRAASNLTSSTVRAEIHHTDLFFGKTFDCIANSRKYSAIEGL